MAASTAMHENRMAYLNASMGTISRAISRTVSCAAVLVLTACGSDTGFAPSHDAHVLLKSIQLTGRAYNLATEAPYDTVLLHANAFMADGTPVPNENIRYSVSNGYIRVDSSGLLHAVRGTDQGGSSLPKVYASVTFGGQTVRDSAPVVVTAGHPVLIKSVSVTKPRVLNFETLTFDETDGTLQIVWPLLNPSEAMSATVSDFSDAIRYDIVTVLFSSDSNVVQLATTGDWNVGLTSYTVVARQVGEAWVYASAYIYGTTFRDSLLIRVKEPLQYVVEGNKNVVQANGHVRVIFRPDSITIPAGADVSWRNKAPTDLCAQGWCSSAPLDVIFDDSVAQYVLASRVPPALDRTDYFRFLLSGGFNEHGGTGSIPAFKVVAPDPSKSDAPQCAFEPPWNCLVGSEARRFDRPGVYRYRSSQGATGVIVVRPPSN